MSAITPQKLSVDSIHYHTGVFETNKTVSVLYTGLIGLTLLVVGLLALYYQDQSISISPLACKGMVIAGTISVVCSSSLLAYFFRKEQKVKSEMDAAIVESEQRDKAIQFLARTLISTPQVPKIHDARNIGRFVVVICTENNNKSLHIFSNREDYVEYTKDLSTKGSQFGNVKNSLLFI